MGFDYGSKRSDGQYENYPTKVHGEFVAPLRFSYVHDECGGVTSISKGIAETYAKYPNYYTSTFCAKCGDHFYINEFKWKEDGVPLGEIGPSPDEEGSTEAYTDWPLERLADECLERGITCDINMDPAYVRKWYAQCGTGDRGVGLSYRGGDDLVDTVRWALIDALASLKVSKSCL